MSLVAELLLLPLDLYDISNLPKIIADEVVLKLCLVRSSANKNECVCMSEILRHDLKPSWYP